MADLPETSANGAGQTNGQTDIQVEVAYAKPDTQAILTVQVAPGTTAEQAMQASGITERFPELAQLTGQDLKMGIFGKACKPAQVVRDGDRIELYRPLIADPKKVRKERAAKGKQTRKGAKALTE